MKPQVLFCLFTMCATSPLLAAEKAITLLQKSPAIHVSREAQSFTVVKDAFGDAKITWTSEGSTKNATALADATKLTCRVMRADLPPNVLEAVGTIRTTKRADNGEDVLTLTPSRETVVRILPNTASDDSDLFAEGVQLTRPCLSYAKEEKTNAQGEVVRECLEHGDPTAAYYGVEAMLELTGARNQTFTAQVLCQKWTTIKRWQGLTEAMKISAAEWESQMAPLLTVKK